MSWNMGYKTNTGDGLGTGSAASMSIGLIPNKICPACNKPKKPGTSHPKCSRVLQGMSRRGEI